ncbi:hypothetical protein [Alysiella sp.]|uniref:hypothetical protein n=1 Tax=Alysiella sp. TaxID=1872483 RepID=UPI0026DA7B2A|nr:hypothetical protein [Alysiella sp.]
MRLQYLIFSLVWCLLAACSDEKTESSSASAAPVVSVPSKQKVAVVSAETNVYAHYANINQAALAKLKNLSPVQADQFYIEYRKQVITALEAINAQEQLFLDDFLNDANWDYDAISRQSKPSANMQKHINHLNEYGLRYEDLGGGVAAIVPKVGIETELFATKTTSEYRDFILQQDRESTLVDSMDGAVVVSWRELADRAAAWERFVQNYPNSALLDEAEQKFQWNTYLFLFGLDNTPVEAVEYDEPEAEQLRQFYREIEAEWARYEQHYPRSRIVPMLAEARQIALLEGEARLDAVKRFRDRYLSDAFRS